MATFSTAVRMISVSAPTFFARRAAAASLSITAGTPARCLPFEITGIPPPPQQITTCPSSAIDLIAESSMISFGAGEATTLL